MMTWWKSRTERERLAIVVAGAFAAILLAAQFGLFPLLRAHQLASERYIDARNEHAEVEVLLDSVIHGADRNPADAATPPQPLDIFISQQASLAGLSINRIEPTVLNGVLLEFDDVDTKAFFAWLEKMETYRTVSIARADLRRETTRAQTHAIVELASTK